MQHLNSPPLDGQTRLAIKMLEIWTDDSASFYAAKEDSQEMKLWQQITRGGKVTYSEVEKAKYYLCVVNEKYENGAREGKQLLAVEKKAVFL